MTTYYVSTTGDDNDDGSVSTPFASIKKGIETATSDGDIVEIVDSGIFVVEVVV